MKKVSFCFYATLFSLCCVCPVQAESAEESIVDSLSIGGGISRHNNIAIARFAIRKDANADFFKTSVGWMDVYSEASFGFWDKGDDQIYVGAYSPVFIYYFGDETWSVHPYIEAGIGVAGISQTKIDTRDLSTAFQFEDRIGIGARMKDLDLSFRYMHYSNGSIVLPNDGIDIFIFTAGYRF